MRILAAAATLLVVCPALAGVPSRPHAAPGRRATATRSADGLWADASERDILARDPSPRALVPRASRTLSLNVAAFRDLAAGAPREFTPGADSLAPVITLPMPDGTFERFTIEESPVIDDSLAKQLPEVRTYRAEGIDDPTAWARLDYTAFGFHGFVVTAEGTVFIDPFRRGDTTHYMSYWRRDYARSADIPPFRCGTRNAEPPATATAHASASRVSAQYVTTGPTLRTYRLAMACTGEYAAYYGGTVSGAQNAIITTVNRVNGIYEKELAVRLTLVNNTAIIFTNATTDPYLNTSDDLDANQTTIDNAIGSTNYDIGHLVGTGGGGVAYLGVVCSTAFKAHGLTGSSSPVGDAFDVDYVAHEIGHQFGSDHTFNGTSGACNGNRAAGLAYEPGSGSTIMAYAGICAPEDLQPHSDAYFHAKSFDDINSYLATTSCAAQTSSGNSGPVVSAGATATIPASTPFSLTGSATDPNGDSLTYCWEEFDLGTASPPNTDDGSRPIFRSFTPVANGTRVFPKMADVLAGTATFGESLPTTSRTMTFRLTARDNRSGGGGVGSATTTVAVVGTAGPFTVTAPAAAAVLTSGATPTVTWNVANTTAAPINCANVSVALSTDGGANFGTTLLASTPNDGTQSVTLPAVVTTKGRIKVGCTTSPFFNVSPGNFTITSGLAAPTGFSAAATGTNSVQLSWNGTSAADTYEVYRSSSALTFVKVYTMVLTQQQIGSTGVYTWTDSGNLTASTAYIYYVRALASGAASSPSASDVATTLLFTDDPLQSGVTTIKSLHLTQIRTAIDAVHVLAGLGHVIFTDPTPLGIAIKSVHMTELRTALDQARAALLLPAISYTNSGAASTPVRAQDLTELRNAVR